MIEIKKLSELCQIPISDGTHQTPTYCDDGYIFLSSKNVVGGFIDWDNIKFIPENLHNELYKRIKPQRDDILLAKNGTTGTAAIVDRDEVFNIYVSLALIRPNQELVLPRYLLYAINSVGAKRYFDSHLKGVGVPNLHLNHIRETPIKMVDLTKQVEIVRTLDKIIGVIEKRKQQLAELDTLIKARFVEMFGTLENPIKRFETDVLKNLCNKITDGKHGGCTSEEGTERYFVGAREIYDDAIHYDFAPEINVAEFEKDYKRCNMEKGDFLIVNTGATIGKSAIAVDDKTEHTLLQKSVALLKVKSDLLNPVFLKWCYRVNTKMYMVESASAQPNLLLSKINATEIYVPPINLQIEFEQFVKQVDKSRVAVQKSLGEMQLLFDSLMQKYFG